MLKFATNIFNFVNALLVLLVIVIETFFINQTLLQIYFLRKSNVVLPSKQIRFVADFLNTGLLLRVAIKYILDGFPAHLIVNQLLRLLLLMNRVILVYRVVCLTQPLCRAAQLLLLYGRGVRFLFA